MKTIHTTTFVVFSIPWIIVNSVCATEPYNKQLPTNDSIQLSSLINGTNNANSTQLSSDLNGAIADSKQLSSVLNRRNADSKLLLHVRNGTIADNKQISSVLNGSNSDNKQQTSVLNGTIAKSKQIPHVVGGTSADSKQAPRVLGGTSADRLDFAYVAQVFNNKALCGGTIVTARSILTASHCFMISADPQFIIIAVGNTGKTVLDPQTRKLPIWDLALHDEFEENGFLVNDIALLFLNNPITLGYAVRRAFLVDTDAFLFETGEEFHFAGWGTTTYPPVVMSQYGLQQISFRLVPQEECGELNNITLIDEVFCLYKGEGEDTCSGDSGGGVKWNEMIVGIVSCGDGCGAADLPGLYTNVFSYLDWIEDRLQVTNARMCTHDKLAGGPK